jgi:hypothetical protein
MANAAFLLYNDPVAVERARGAIRARIERARPVAA